MITETIDFTTSNGHSSAYVAMPEGEAAKAVIVVQEWWGLNDHIKDIAGRYANEGFVAIAPDLYRGVSTDDPAEASKMMHALAFEDGVNTIKCSMDAARKKYGISHFGITGYCMGGTFALRSACELEGISACAAFYGDIPEDDVLRQLTAPVIFISGKRDAWITPEKVAGLERAADRFELPVTSLVYDADHAFFNDTRPDVYDAAAAKDAWAVVTGFFSDKL